MEDVPKYVDDRFRESMTLIQQCATFIERQTGGFGAGKRIKTITDLLDRLEIHEGCKVAEDLAHILNQWCARLEDREQLLVLAADPSIPKSQLVPTLVKRRANKAVIVDLALQIKRKPRKRPTAA